jgi:hypothetical protein
MLSTIPRLADKAFVIGHLLPSIIFFALVIFIFDDKLSYYDVHSALMEKGDVKIIVYISIIIWVGATLLLILNNVLIKGLEGYIWPFSAIFSAVSQEKQRYDRKFARFSELEEQWRSSKKSGDPFPDNLKEEYDAILMDLVTCFPARHLILPTRFGNAMRAFEDYSRQVYGADAIPLWVHLNAVISKEFQAAVADAQARINFLVNSIYLLMIILILPLIRLFFLPTGDAGITFAICAILSAALIYIFYKLSIMNVYTCGCIVKAAFDCYLPALAKQLGYSLPHKGADQYRFWQEVSQRAIYHLAINPEDWRVEDKAGSDQIGADPS